VAKAIERLRKLCGDEALDRLLHAAPCRIALDIGPPRETPACS